MTYKKKDEIAAAKASNLNTEKALGKRNLLEKFGFSDDEDTLVWLFVSYLTFKLTYFKFI